MNQKLKIIERKLWRVLLKKPGPDGSAVSAVAEMRGMLDSKNM
jgi:hypothetical protein